MSCQSESCRGNGAGAVVRMDVIGCSSRMTSEDACASEDVRAIVNGMLLCAPGVFSGHGISHGSRVKDSVLRCHT